MYRKIHCDWFLSDGIFPAVRLDAPMYVEDALISCERIRAEMTNLEHMAVEWIYRRIWTYSTDFDISGSERCFLRLSGLKGSWRALINGAEAARGTGGSAVFEVTQGLMAHNHLEICFDADNSGALRPVTGFGGMLSCRQTGTAAITKLNITEDARLFAALDLLQETETELRLSIKNSAGRHESSMQETLAFGYTPLVFDEMSEFLQIGEANEVTLEAWCEGKISDSCLFTAFLSDETVQPRGFLAESEELIALAEKAGALSAFTPDAEPDFSHRQLCARHGLESVSAEALPSYIPAPAAQPLERLIALAGSEEKLELPEIWKLSGSDRQCLDKLKSQVPSGDIEKLIALNRYRQAESLRADALDARMNDRCFVVSEVQAQPAMPASSSLMDTPGHMRPAYYALMSAWQGEVGYVQQVETVQNVGIVTCEVCYVSDLERPHADALSVIAFDISGNRLLANSFPVLEQGTVGRFTFELPSDSIAIIRTSLVKGEESVISTDEVLMAENRSIEDLPLTQLLAADGKITNVGTATALGVCVPGAGYFGCLLPGECVHAMQGDPDEAEGLNIFI